MGKASMKRRSERSGIGYVIQHFGRTSLFGRRVELVLGGDTKVGPETPCFPIDGNICGNIN